MLKRFTAVALVAGHGAIHVTLPFFDLFIHLIAALIFFWSFRHD